MDHPAWEQVAETTNKHIKQRRLTNPCWTHEKDTRTWFGGPLPKSLQFLRSIYEDFL